MLEDVWDDIILEDLEQAVKTSEKEKNERKTKIHEKENSKATIRRENSQKDTASRGRSCDK